MVHRILLYKPSKTYHLFHANMKYVTFYPYLNTRVTALPVPHKRIEPPSCRQKYDHLFYHTKVQDHHLGTQRI
jgi:hypothetical protein